MLEIIHRIGTVVFWLCFIIGVILVVLGYWMSIVKDDTTVYVFWYIFAAAFLIVAFLVRYIFCKSSFR